MQTPPQQEPKPAPRRGLVMLGAAAALAAGLGGAWLLSRGGRDEATVPPASAGGLVIDTTAAGDGRIDPARPLRCFVQGQFVGELILADCARRNGIATDALDVGLDQTGALAAAEQYGAVLAPLPPPEETALPQDEVAASEGDPDETDAPTAELQPCQRFAGGRWRQISGGTELNACVQALFSGHCERQGGAAYGRWGDQTLRLITGRVEVSDDNQSFQLLSLQGANCSVAPVP